MCINRFVAVALATPLIITGCSNTGSFSNTALGCMGGAVLGAGVVMIDSRDPGKAVLGGLIGGALGCAVGNYLDKREAELAKVAEENDFKPEFERITSTKESGMAFSKDAADDVIASQISINSDKPLFGSNQATVNEPEKLKKLRGFLKGYVETMAAGSKIYVVGHTDSTGSANYNQRLSEKRARYIAGLLADAGAHRDNIYYEGVGESQPIASNQSDIGKARNRRFELIDVIATREKSKDNKQHNTAPLENVVQVAAAKKKRIENVTNTLPKTSEKQRSSEKTAKVAMVPQVKKSQVSRQESLDLGGVPLKSFDEQYVTSAFGYQKSNTSWSFFAKANASSDAPLVGSCAYAGPVVQSKLKTFSGRPVRSAKVSESVPNLYGTAWFGMAGKTGVTLGPIGIKKETLDPSHIPRLSFYKNYNGKATSSDYSYPVSVETYKGDDTVLVRMYAKDDSALMKCSDVVFSTKGGQLTKASAVIYQEQDELMAKAFNMKLVKG